MLNFYCTVLISYNLFSYFTATTTTNTTTTTVDEFCTFSFMNAGNFVTSRWQSSGYCDTRQCCGMAPTFQRN